jgi:hypothetical protein
MRSFRPLSVYSANRGFKVKKYQESIVHEQAIEENLHTSFTLFFPFFNVTTD